MKMPGLYTEADYENSVIELFRNDLGYEYAYGPDIERDFYSPLYEEVLLDSLYRLNRGLPDDAIQDALFKLKNFENGELVQKNAVSKTSTSIHNTVRIGLRNNCFRCIDSIDIVPF